MTDLEITRFCAGAMEFKPDVRAKYRSLDSEFNGIWVNDGSLAYDPLHDDAQAMALVKKFELELMSPASGNGGWKASDIDSDTYARSTDLNRAICECVAKMGAA